MLSQVFDLLLKVKDVDAHLFSVRASAITASFSTGFNEQVEYTIRPPSVNIFIARKSILTCKLIETTCVKMCSTQSRLRAPV